MILTRDLMIETARGWIGTPYKHQGQRKGVACDCKGLICGVPLELGLPEAQTLAARTRDYATAFSGKTLVAGLNASLRRLRTAPQPADVLAILWGRDPWPRHLAFVSDQPGFIIHAYGGGVRAVAEVPLGGWRVHSAYTWPSLEGTDG